MLYLPIREWLTSYGKLLDKYTSPMDPMAKIPFGSCFFLE